MHRNIQAGFLLQAIQRITDLFHRLVLAGERHAQRWHDTNGVFVNALEHFFRVHDQTIAFQRDFTQLYVKVTSKLVPADLYRATNQVRFIARQPLLGTLFAPLPFQRQPTQHGGFRGTDG
ncbi:hypothetical protein D3C75_920000 [compost metagenome]